MIELTSGILQLGIAVRKLAETVLGLIYMRVCHGKEILGKGIVCLEQQRGQ